MVSHQYGITIDGEFLVINERRPAIREYRTPFCRWLRIQLRLAFEDFAAYLAR